MMADYGSYHSKYNSHTKCTEKHRTILVILFFNKIQVADRMAVTQVPNALIVKPLIENILSVLYD